MWGGGEGGVGGGGGGAVEGSACGASREGQGEATTQTLQCLQHSCSFHRRPDPACLPCPCAVWPLPRRLSSTAAPKGPSPRSWLKPRRLPWRRGRAGSSRPWRKRARRPNACRWGDASVRCCEQRRLGLQCRIKPGAARPAHRRRPCCGATRCQRRIPPCSPMHSREWFSACTATVIINVLHVLSVRIKAGKNLRPSTAKIS